MPSMLYRRAEEMGVELTPVMIEQFNNYEKILVEWNEKINLTAITDSEGIEEKHFLDSIACLKAIKKENFSLIDIGTGAGFPGIPIKIARPDSNITLIDSLNKRVNFLKEVITELNLDDIHALHGRAEEYARKVDFREKYDFATARAVAKINVLLEYCLPYVKIGGAFLCQKSIDWKVELNDAKNALKVLGGEVEDCIDVKIPQTNYTRVIIVIRKVKSVDMKYPRSQGKIDKAPL